MSNTGWVPPYDPDDDSTKVPERGYTSDGEPRTKTLAERIQEWDDEVEDSDDQSNARDPFDAGVMLAVASLFEVYDGSRETYDEQLARVVEELRQTVEQVIE